MKKDIFTYEKCTAIVTGATSGIGAEIARTLSRVGYNVAIVGRNKERGRRVVDEILSNDGEAFFFEADISDDKECESLVESIYAWKGSIGVLVNCAGVLTSTKIEDITREEWDEVLSTNLSGTFFMTQKALPFLKEAKNPRVINISSNAGRMGGYANSQSYTASKGGIISITMGIARQFAKYGITVNVVCPGTTETEMVALYDDEVKERLKERIPLHRLGTCEEVASAVCYLASREAGFITGAILDVNGGLYMG